MDVWQVRRAADPWPLEQYVLAYYYAGANGTTSPFRSNYTVGGREMFSSGGNITAERKCPGDWGEDELARAVSSLGCIFSSGKI